MTKLILSRRGALLYAVAAPLLMVLFALPMMMPSAAGIWSNPFNPIALDKSVFIGLAAYMGFALCAWAVCVVWVIRIRRGKNLLLTVLLALLLWLAAAPAAPVIYLLNLIWLIGGKYPELPWRPVSWVRLLPMGALVLTVILLAVFNPDHPSAGPAAAPEDVFRQHRIDADILAKLPQEDGSLLLVTFEGCGIVEQQEAGWVLREAYPGEMGVLVDGQQSAFTYISRSPAGGQDVVIVMKNLFPMNDPAIIDIPPRDTAGSVFTRVGEGDAVRYFYTLVDADAPGYELFYQ